MHISSRAVSTLLFGVAIIAMCPSLAGAQSMTMSECKKNYGLKADNPQGKRPLQPGEAPDTIRPWTTSGNVFIVCDESQLFADEVEYFEETKILKARGHVNFIDGNQRISADHFEFNTKTKLGTFYKAQGIMTIAGKPDPTGTFAAVDADAYFSGEVIEKLGPDKYRFKNGVFTTCVQPTPRWEVVGSTMVFVRDKRALLWNSVFRIKNVPVFYLPFMYYPMSKDGRNTGFLMPVYGHDTSRGQTFSESFFLVLGRSMDATLDYEYTSLAGSGYGGEYRYIQAPGSEGNLRVKVFNGKSTADPLLQSRRVEMFGTMAQRLPKNWQLRGNVNYTDNVQARQLTQQDLLLRSDSSRYAGANVQGSVGKILITGEASLTDRFTKVDNSLVASRNGMLPHVRADWPSTPIGKTKIYFGMAGDLAGILRQDDIDRPETDRGLVRFDTHPTLRMPIGSLPYLSVIAQVGMQFTYWSEQLNAQGLQIKDPLTRQLMDVQMSFRGPTFAKIFDTPGSKYATRWKHVVEPTVSVTRLSAFDGVSKVAKNDSTDNIVGGTTNVQYALSNRLLAKRPALGGQAVEVASIIVSQTYYSTAAASLADTSYQGKATESQFSAIAVTANIQPTARVSGNMQLSIDSKYHEVRELSAGAGVNGRNLNGTLTWSRRFFIEGLSGFDNKASLNQSITTAASYRSPDNRLTSRVGWSYDFQNKHQLNRSAVVSYMSQCCGVAVSYQTSYVGAISSTVQQNRIFKLSFSLGGLGTFSPSELFR